MGRGVSLLDGVLVQVDECVLKWGAGRSSFLPPMALWNGSVLVTESSRKFRGLLNALGCRGRGAACDVHRSPSRGDASASSLSLFSIRGADDRWDDLHDFRSGWTRTR